ncbi:hypothetical protein B0H10DRAFT_2135054 [Mycena sp. CBHHK59/15]|nr:hypothetical protein B0H10DRAFT_2135054 [Mycena sp. CBHHK59/15]
MSVPLEFEEDGDRPVEMVVFAPLSVNREDSTTSHPLEDDEGRLDVGACMEGE